MAAEVRRCGGALVEEEKKYVFQTFRNLRREVSRGTVHEVVAHELRPRDCVDISINSL